MISMTVEIMLRVTRATPVTDLCVCDDGYTGIAYNEEATLREYM